MGTGDVKLYAIPRATKANSRRNVWQLRWFGVNGTRYCETIGDCAKMDKLQARAVQRQRQSKMDCDLVPVDPPRSQGLEDFLARDREAVSGARKSRTIDGMSVAADHAVAVLGADLDVQRLGPEHVGRVTRSMRDLGLAPATIVKVVAYLQGAFTRGVRHGFVTRNHFASAELPKVQSNKVTFFTADQVAALVAAAPTEWWRTMIRLAFTSGLRQGELVNLLWEDVDLERGVVTVAPKSAGTFSAGGREYPVLHWTAKDYETRVIPIPGGTAAELRRFREWFQGATRSAYVFLSLDTLDLLAGHMESHGGRLPDKLVNNLQRDFARIRARAEAASAERVDDPEPWGGLSFKDLRSGFATLAAQHVRPHELQRLMGHSDIKTTMTHYVGDSDTGERVRRAFASAS